MENEKNTEIERAREAQRVGETTIRNNGAVCGMENHHGTGGGNESICGARESEESIKGEGSVCGAETDDEGREENWRKRGPEGVAVGAGKQKKDQEDESKQALEKAKAEKARKEAEQKRVRDEILRRSRGRV